MLSANRISQFGRKKHTAEQPELVLLILLLAVVMTVFYVYLDNIFIAFSYGKHVAYRECCK